MRRGGGPIKLQGMGKIPEKLISRVGGGGIYLAPKSANQNVTCELLSFRSHCCHQQVVF